MNPEVLQAAALTVIISLVGQGILVWASFKVFQARAEERQRHEDEWRDYVKEELEKLTNQGNSFAVARAADAGWQTTVNELGREILTLRNFKHDEVMPALATQGTLIKRVDRLENKVFG